MTTKEKTRESTRKRSDVVYTQPKPFQRRRIILNIITVVAVVVALVLGMAIFFKVDEKNAKISGVEKYSAWEVWQASGIQDGDNLLTLNKAKIAARIMSELPYVANVRISITLPDTVNIRVEELTESYAVQAADSSWWLIASDAKVLEKITEANAANYAKLVGVQITDPKPGKTAVAFEPEPEVGPDGETIPVTVYGSEKLQAATAVLQELERNGVLDVIKLVDVTDIYAIQLWRGDRFRVDLGDTTRLDEKILALKAYVEQNGKDSEMIVDVSLTQSDDGYYYETWPEE